MGPLNDPTCKEIGEILSDYDRTRLLEISSGLLTAPSLAANSVRLETLVHLSLIHAQGSKVPTRKLFNSVLNEAMGSSMMAMMEDPVEDVFVSNVHTSFGDCLIFNGLWEGNDYFIQSLVDLVDRSSVPEVMQEAKKCCIALVRLSNEIAIRANLTRNESVESYPNSGMKIPSSDVARNMAKRVSFTEKDMVQAGIDVEELAPFIISEAESEELHSETLGNTTLERKPIVLISGTYIVTLPNSIGIAIRKFFLEECRRENLLQVFQSILVRYQTDQLKNESLRELKGEAFSVSFEVETISNLPPITSLLLKDLSENYYHFLMIHDDLEQLLEEGFDSFHSFEESNEKALYSFTAQCADHCKAQVGFRQGTTICVHGGLGRGVGLGFEEWPDDWGFVAISLADLNLLSMAGGKPLKELIYSAKQSRWMQDKGIHVQNINGDINFYGYWKENGYECCPPDISLEQNNLLSFGTDYVYLVRRDLRISSDRHCSLDVSGNWVRCERLTKDSFFEGMKSLPIYGCIDHIEAGFLNGLIELEFINVWFGVSVGSTNIDSSVVYEWWSGFINLLCECLLVIDSKTDYVFNKPIQVNLDLQHLAPASDLDFDSDEAKGICLSIEETIITLTFERNFLANFMQVENEGEYQLVSAVLSEIGKVLQANGLDISGHISLSLESVLSDNGVRIIHLYRTFDLSENTLMKSAVKPIYMNQPEEVFNGLLISASTGIKDKVLSNKKDCGKYLHSRVDIIWSEIKRILNTINRKSLLVKLIKNINSIEQDRQHWSRTAKAVQAIHQKHDNVTSVAGSIESKRSLSSLCSRVLVEMSVCECPVDGGVESNDADLAQLISLCSILVRAAADSDAMNSDLIDPSIEIHLNGSYTTPTDILDSVLKPYYAGYFEFEFKKSVDAYEQMYAQIKNKDSGTEETFTKDFSSAFTKEFGFTPNQYLDCIGEIIDQIILSKEEYILIGIDKLTETIHANRNIPIETIQNFIECFSIKSRSNWDTPPRGFVFRDIAPWKHKRKLSCLVRPLIESHEKQLLCSLALIKQSCMYFIERTMDGLFIPGFFNSSEMKSFVGRMIEKRGAEFTETIGKYFENLGWQVRTEVLMPTLGAPQELGDIDVLLLSNDGRLIAIECKNLQMAKTISEVAGVLNRFKGHGENDELLKHLKRASWVSRHITQVRDRVGFNGEAKTLEHYLLTNTEMPMRYASGLPIGIDQIKSFRNISEISKID
jgi:hypothetical protein